MDKIAEFEAKAETLQSLKTNLYAAIESLHHSETVTNNSGEVESQTQVSTSIEEEEST